MPDTLWSRIIGRGTLNEPEGKPDPTWALPSTLNWMHGMALLTSGLDWKSARGFYSQEGKRAVDDLAVNTTLEQLFLSLHHLSTLNALKNVQPADVGRIGVLAWYYGTSNAASAMISAKASQFQEDHSGTARIWDLEIAKPGLAMEPFSWRVSSLVEATFKPEVSLLGDSSSGALQTKPLSEKQARDAAASYLSGSAKWYAWKTQEEVRASKEFKALGVKDFRKKVARDLRDQRLLKKPVGFMHQAMRYRGKANYREALFLAYGANTSASMSGFAESQESALRAFLIMAGAYCSRKLGSDIWDEFVKDVETNHAFTLSPYGIWT
ncbi:hypothetical protein BH09PSE2_BH09PSE2_18920 [soil metagenome]